MLQSVANAVVRRTRFDRVHQLPIANAYVSALFLFFMFINNLYSPKYFIKQKGLTTTHIA